MTTPEIDRQQILEAGVALSLPLLGLLLPSSASALLCAVAVLVALLIAIALVRSPLGLTSALVRATALSVALYYVWSIWWGRQ